MRLAVLRGQFAISQLGADAAIPGWASGEFVSITRTRDELSIVCEAPDGDWRCIQVQGPLDFALTGVLSSLATPLAEAGISIFAVATYNTDYLLVKSDKLDAAMTALKAAGHEFL